MSFRINLSTIILINELDKTRNARVELICLFATLGSKAEMDLAFTFIRIRDIQYLSDPLKNRTGSLRSAIDSPLFCYNCTTHTNMSI